MTKKQPLHYACDTIHACIITLDGLDDNLNNMQILSVHNQTQHMKERLEKTLTTLREKALREEGEYRV